jgi:glycosyltransferase involved in cell wall biosynthesis
MAQAIARYISDDELRSVHGRRGRHRAEQHFSITGMVNAYMRMYDELLTERVATRGQLGRCSQ